MYQLTRYLRKPLNPGRFFLIISLCLGLCSVAQSAGYSGDFDNPALYPINQYSNAAPVITCGEHAGKRPATLNIRGSDVATLWRSAYRMLFPGFSLADNKKFNRVAAAPHKGPAWGISINKRTALMTVQTKW